ncbi:MAG TPA: zinc ribbon domain-containing protein [Blastocatellia bacterium]|nr:zinc ribbon domain-containing protein [Blastocatellia bacterium]
MHCPSCGAEATVGLKYCKRCGENLGHSFQMPQYRDQGSDSGGTIWIAVAAWALALSTVAITLGGFGIIFTHVFDLMRPAPPGFSSAGEADKIAGLMLGIGSLVIFGIVAMLIRVFSKLMGLNSSRAEKSSPPRAIASDYPHQQLSPPPPSVSSVTEHTTRNFDLPQYREPNARE